MADRGGASIVKSGQGKHGHTLHKQDYEEWSKVFLAHLAATSNVSASARKAGVATSTVYEVRRTRPEFAQKWYSALCEGYELLEMETLCRLRSGEMKPGSGSKRSVRTFENGAAIRLLLAHRDTVAQLRAVRENHDEKSVLASLNAKLEAMRQRMNGSA